MENRDKFKNLLTEAYRSGLIHRYIASAVFEATGSCLEQTSDAAYDIVSRAEGILIEEIKKNGMRLPK